MAHYPDTDGVLWFNDGYKGNKLNTLCILNNDKALNITQLSSLIKQSAFVIANDTGPAHMAAHLNVKGLALFGSHTTAKKVSIETMCILENLLEYCKYWNQDIDEKYVWKEQEKLIKNYSSVLTFDRNLYKIITMSTIKECL